MAVDRRDAEGLAALFVAGGGIDVHVPGRAEPVAVLRGQAALGGLLEALAVYRTTMHVVSNFVAEVEGDEAAAVTYTVAHHYAEPHVERLFVVYDDRFARTPDGWRFTVRSVQRLWTERAPAGQEPLLVDRAMRKPER